MSRIFLTFATAAIALAPMLALAGEREDKATAEQIAVVLRDSGQMQNYSVGVKYKNGTVWLSGRVASNQQMQAALAVISEIEGIEKIVNNLDVAKGTAAKSSAAKPGTARRVSVTSAEIDGASPPAGKGDVTPAGYHKLKHAARNAGPVPAYVGGAGGQPPAYDQPHMPNYAWPSYASYPNYAAVSYPKQYSPTAWPFIGPFYPYPQVPLGWRKVALEWDDGWWFLDFYDRSHH
jgi:hypothetical protein